MAIEAASGVAPLSSGIDVAVPSYQYGRFLRDCVQSVLAQAVAGLRILIIDNASTDDSLEVAQQLARENPSVSVTAHRRNLGPHASFNEAVDWASQKYFLILCADDLLLPGALARAISVLDARPDVVMSYGRAALLGPAERPPAGVASDDTDTWRIIDGHDLLKRFCSSGVCHIASCTAIVRTEVQKSVGYYRPALPHTDDFEMWLRFACHGPVAETAALQGALRAHEDSQSAYVRRQHRWDILNCRAAFDSFFNHEGSHLRASSDLRRRARHGLGDRAYWSAASHLSRGDVKEAMALLGLALQLRPACALLPPLSYLLRREDARSRLMQVMTELVTRRVVTANS